MNCDSPCGSSLEARIYFISFISLILFHQDVLSNNEIFNYIFKSNAKILTKYENKRLVCYKQSDEFSILKDYVKRMTLYGKISLMDGSISLLEAVFDF